MKVYNNPIIFESNNKSHNYNKNKVISFGNIYLYTGRILKQKEVDKYLNKVCRETFFEKCEHFIEKFKNFIKKKK